MALAEYEADYTVWMHRCGRKREYRTVPEAGRAIARFHALGQRRTMSIYPCGDHFHIGGKDRLV